MDQATEGLCPTMWDGSPLIIDLDGPLAGQAAFFFGTLAPERRASDKPMAIACFGFVTFLPLRPLFSLPRLNSCISRSTLFCAFGPYFRPRLEDFFDDELWDRLEPLLCRELDDELDLLRDELFLCDVAIEPSLLCYSDACRIATGCSMNSCWPVLRFCSGSS